MVRIFGNNGNDILSPYIRHGEQGKEKINTQYCAKHQNEYTCGTEINPFKYIRLQIHNAHCSFYIDLQHKLIMR